MQGLSSRAHAFSVEALVGKPCKRMKVSEGQESSSAGDTGSIFTGEAEGLLDSGEHFYCFNLRELYAQDGTIKPFAQSAVCTLFCFIRHISSIFTIYLDFIFYQIQLFLSGKRFSKYSPCQMLNRSNFLSLF